MMQHKKRPDHDCGLGVVISKADQRIAVPERLPQTVAAVGAGTNLPVRAPKLRASSIGTGTERDPGES